MQSRETLAIKHDDGSNKILFPNLRTARYTSIILSTHLTVPALRVDVCLHDHDHGHGVFSVVIAFILAVIGIVKISS
jgi:hypothetical protein